MRGPLYAEGLIPMAFNGQSLLRAQLDHSWDGGGSPAEAGPRMFHGGDEAHSGRGILSCFGEETMLPAIMGSAFCLAGPGISVPHSVSQTGHPSGGAVQVCSEDP